LGWIIKKRKSKANASLLPCDEFQPRKMVLVIVPFEELLLLKGAEHVLPCLVSFNKPAAELQIEALLLVQGKVPDLLVKKVLYRFLA